MASETVVQASVTDPAFKVLADQIIAISSRMREDAHDQETIRCALQSFSHALHGARGLDQPAAIGSTAGRPY